MSPWKPLPGNPGRPRPVGESLNRVTAALGVPQAGTLRAVFGTWAQIVGEGLAAHARPRSLRAGTLVVAVDDPAWATEVRWATPTLLARLAESVGPGAVKSIEVVVAPS